MKSSILFLFLLTSFAAISQEVKLFSERTEKGFSLYASNNEFSPATVSLDLELNNLSFSEGSKKEFIIPAKNDKYKLGEINIVKPGEKTKYSYQYTAVLGDLTKKIYDKEYEYDLPFQKGKSFHLYQGYNGTFSHHNEKAVDFTMPEGTEILAAREGVVVKVVQHNSQSCMREECKEYNNYVTIYHPDGTFANYVHLRLNGSNVKPGDVVKKGAVIAYSGNTGWSSGPHLHFVCYLPGKEKHHTIETKFKIDNGTKATFLQEKTTYTRNY